MFNQPRPPPTILTNPHYHQQKKYSVNFEYRIELSTRIKLMYNLNIYNHSPNFGPCVSDVTFLLKGHLGPHVSDVTLLLKGCFGSRSFGACKFLS